MHRSALFGHLFQNRLELVKLGSLNNADCAALFFQGRLGSHPDNIIYGQVAAEDAFFALVDVDNGGQAGEVKPEKVQK
ncbi:hypothetical protein ES703_73956 [subsurface metagenome]